MELLQVTKYRDGSHDREGVQDADGNPIFKDGYVRVIEPTSWLAAGEVVRVKGATSGGLSPVLQIETARNSSTGVYADNVQAVGSDQNDEIGKQFELTFLYHRQAQINTSISTLHAERISVGSRIREIEGV